MTYTPRTQIPRPMATVDVVVLTIKDNALCVALHQRAHDPFTGAWALPGGFIRTESHANTEQTAREVMARKLGPSRFHIEQLETFSCPDRDPDGWSLSVAYLALVPLSALSDCKEDVALFDVAAVPELAFDHARILDVALERLRGKGAYSTLPASLLPEHFTLPDMERVYSLVLGAKVDSSSFRRKIRDLGIIEAVGDAPRQGAGRPATLYALSGAVGAFNKTLSTR